MTDHLQEAWSWYLESGLGGVVIPVPLVETVAVFTILTVCLLFRFSRIGLIVAYAFVYRWGWVLRELIFPGDSRFNAVFVTAYIVFGILAFTFAIVGMMRAER